MANRTAIGILVISSLLFGFIFFFEKDTMSTDEKKSRSENVFKDLRVDFVSRVELKGTKGRLVLFREGTEGGATVDGADWMVTGKGEYKADLTEVRSILSAMDFLLIERTVEAGKSGYGLSKPTLEGKVVFKDEQISFRIGKKTQDKNSVYVAVDGQDEVVYVVSLEFLDSLDKGVNDVRNRKIVDVNVDEVTSVSVTGGASGVELQRDSEKGWLVGMDSMKLPASASQVQQLLRAVANLEAVEFVADGASALKKWGLDKPALRVVLSTGERTLEVALGKGCKEGGVHVLQKDTGQVVCADGAIWDILRRPAERYIEKKLALFNAEDVTSLKISRGGREVSLAINESGLWSAGTQGSSETDQPGVATLVERLCNSVAESVVFDGEKGEKVAGLSFTLDDKSEEQISIYRSVLDDGTEVYHAARSGLPVLFKVDRSFLEGLEPHALAFRKKVIDNADPAHIERLAINGVVSQTLGKTDDKWYIESPVRSVAGMSSVKKVLELAGRPKASKYITEAGNFGFGNPYAKIVATVVVHSEEDGTRNQTKSTEVVVEIGDKLKDETRYARVSGRDFVFTVGPDLYKPLGAPMAALDALRIDPTGINRVLLKAGARTIEARLINEEWVSDDCDLDSTKLKRLIIDLGAVKAIESRGFGKDVGRQQLALSLYSNKGDVPAMLEFGEPVDDLEGCLARRGDLDVIYVMPQRPVDELLELCR